MDFSVNDFTPFVKGTTKVGKAKLGDYDLRYNHKGGNFEFGKAKFVELGLNGDKGVTPQTHRTGEVFISVQDAHASVLLKGRQREGVKEKSSTFKSEILENGLIANGKLVAKEEGKTYFTLSIIPVTGVTNATYLSIAATTPPVSPDEVATPVATTSNGSTTSTTPSSTPSTPVTSKVPESALEF